MRTRPFVKICCIASLAEARMAMAAGASALGLVSAMPSGPGVVSEASIAEIAREVPPPVATFLLTCATSSEVIIDQQRRCATNTLQLCDYVDVPVYQELRRELPGISLVQVIHVVGPEDVDRARAAAEHVHALLLDSGDTKLEIKELGGTGRAHDWSISRRIRDAVKVPVFLAGGLTAMNVANAIDAVDPFGLDLCSGVRKNDQLDAQKLTSFFSALEQATSPAQSASPRAA